MKHRDEEWLSKWYRGLSAAVDSVCMLSTRPHRGRIIEVEDIDTGERIRDSPQRMLTLVDTLSAMSGAFGHSAEWIAEPSSMSGRY